MTDIDVQEIATRVDGFPSMPGAATRILSLLDSMDTGADQIEEVLRYEPGLTANILKLSNSAFFGLPSQVGSVRQAVMLLGFKRISQMVISSCVSAVMNDSVPGYGIPPGELWRHSIAVSVASELLAKELKLGRTEELCTAALLHDMGKLVLGAFVKEELDTIEMVSDQGIPFVVAEHMVLGTDHAEIGGRILEKWALPQEMVHAVRQHHDPGGAEGCGNLSGIIYTADTLCLDLGLGAGRQDAQPESSAGDTEMLGIPPERIERIRGSIVERTAQLTDVFSGN